MLIVNRESYPRNVWVANGRQFGYADNTHLIPLPSPYLLHRWARFLQRCKAVVTSAEIMVTEAQVEAAKILGEVQDSDEEEEGRRRPRPSPVVDEDELYELQTAAKKAKKAGGTTSQVEDDATDKTEGHIKIDIMFTIIRVRYDTWGSMALWEHGSLLPWSIAKPGDSASFSLNDHLVGVYSSYFMYILEKAVLCCKRR